MFTNHPPTVYNTPRCVRSVYWPDLTWGFIWLRRRCVSSPSLVSWPHRDLVTLYRGVGGWWWCANSLSPPHPSPASPHTSFNLSCRLAFLSLSLSLLPLTTLAIVWNLLAFLNLTWWCFYVLFLFQVFESGFIIGYFVMSVMYVDRPPRLSSSQPIQYHDSFLY